VVGSPWLGAEEATGCLCYAWLEQWPPLSSDEEKRVPVEVWVSWLRRRGSSSGSGSHLSPAVGVVPRHQRRRRVRILFCCVTFPNTWSGCTCLSPPLLPPLRSVSHLSLPLGPSSGICDDSRSHLSDMRDTKEEDEADAVVGARDLGRGGVVGTDRRRRWRTSGRLHGGRVGRGVVAVEEGWADVTKLDGSAYENFRSEPWARVHARWVEDAPNAESA
jgi:hypothetical protein